MGTTQFGRRIVSEQVVTKFVAQLSHSVVFSGDTFDVVSIFWLPVVALNVSDMWNHFVTLPAAVSHDIGRQAVPLVKLSIVAINDSSQSAPHRSSL
jgi:hypothetical protein